MSQIPGHSRGNKEAKGEKILTFVRLDDTLFECLRKEASSLEKTMALLMREILSSRYTKKVRSALKRMLVRAGQSASEKKFRFWVNRSELASLFDEAHREGASVTSLVNDILYTRYNDDTQKTS